MFDFIKKIFKTAKRTPGAVECAPLWEALVAEMRRLGYMPPDEMPLVPELAGHEKKLISLVCLNMKETIKRGVFDEKIYKLFTIIFLKAFDAVYLWHTDPERLIDNDRLLNLSSGPDIRYMPDADFKKASICPASKVIYKITGNWWDANRESTLMDGINITNTIRIAMTAAYRTAVFIAFKEYNLT